MDNIWKLQRLKRSFFSGSLPVNRIFLGGFSGNAVGLIAVHIRLGGKIRRFQV